MSGQLSPEVQEALRPEPRLPFSSWWAIGAGVLAGLVLRLLFFGEAEEAFSPMLSSFILGAPIVVGAVTVYIAESSARRRWSYYFVVPAIANVLFVLGTLIIMIEGLICAVVIVPLFALVGGVAGLAMGAVCRLTRAPRGTVVGCVSVLPLLTGAFEHQLPRQAQFRIQERELYIAAPPSVVWRELIDTRDIQPQELDQAWMYRIGVPLPQQAAGEARGGELLRHITMGKGIHFDQVATEWLENERVSWQYRFAEDSFPARALDDHVRIGGAYFDLGNTTYSLSAQGAGTRLRIRMQYRVSTHFNWYAAPVADLLTADFAARVLAFYGRRAERSRQGVS
jgi:hypothetical protein